MATPDYLLVSDIHMHAWDAFSTTTCDGKNSRLVQTMEALYKAAEHGYRAGARDMFIAGDTFHVRGRLAPSVLNPVIDLFAEILHWGMKVHILAGNHDLEHKEVSRLGSAITALERVGCNVINESRMLQMGSRWVVAVPWIENLEALRHELQRMKEKAGNDHDDTDLIIHAPVNGVIKGLPNAFLGSLELAVLGFKRVFCGHFHNHVNLSHPSLGGEIYSIGALTHQTFSDIGTKAGYLLVGDEVEHFETDAPKFVDLAGVTKFDEAQKLIKGNFVRVKMAAKNQSVVDSAKRLILKSGAAGCIVVPEMVKATASRVSAPLNSTATLEQNVSDFIKASTFTDPNVVAREALAILQDVRASR